MSVIFTDLFNKPAGELNGDESMFDLDDWELNEATNTIIEVADSEPNSAQSEQLYEELINSDELKPLLASIANTDPHHMNEKAWKERALASLAINKLAYRLMRKIVEDEL